MEQTLCIIKPDAVSNKYTGRIIARIESEGFTIKAAKMIHLSQNQAQGFYYVHKERPFFGSLTDFMSSGPAMVMVLEAADAISKWRTLMGATDPAEAATAPSARNLPPTRNKMPPTGRMLPKPRRLKSSIFSRTGNRLTAPKGFFTRA